MKHLFYFTLTATIVAICIMLACWAMDYTCYYAMTHPWLDYIIDAMGLFVALMILLFIWFSTTPKKD